jgi:hypothetical protein
VFDASATIVIIAYLEADLAIMKIFTKINCIKIKLVIKCL